MNASRAKHTSLIFIKSVCKLPNFNSNKYRSVWNKRHFTSSNSSYQVEKDIINYYLSNDNFARNRKKHEQKIKKLMDNYVNGGTDKREIDNILLVKNEENLLNFDNPSSIEEYVNKKCESENIDNDFEYIKKINEKTEIMKILTICGIDIKGEVVYYYTLYLISTLKKYLDKYKDYIIKYEDIMDIKDYYKISNYYYNKEKVVNTNLFFLIYKSLSNTVYSICENPMDKNNNFNICIKNEILNNYNNINDIILKSPSFLNISILFYFINTWMFIDQSRNMKNICLDNFNKYINYISNDEINISSDDMFYLTLATRLYFQTFTYTDILNILNNDSKHFLSVIVLVPNSSELQTNNQTDKYKYLSDYLNTQDKFVEPTKKIHIFPFTFSLGSLKDKTVYILESHEDYYMRNTDALRSYVCWRNFLAMRDGFKLLELCNKNEYDDLFVEEKRDSILSTYANKNCIYNFAEKSKINMEKIIVG
ncbi:hypothetical protein YYG_04185 [Plasmodium vinckei petteri]|uniref:Uncharacterized protein n=1 Tax=Plasmodium vinckei petteri TaxID=138298 RepID=W7ABM5_PLAVN|nr:hypothetical protein YYG_04185 [Plasmodium vinckei petteri]CAD2101478.1 conserved Plasmodium protein, unknown function [Plasmodium vinckei petteri]